MSALFTLYALTSYGICAIIDLQEGLTFQGVCDIMYLAKRGVDFGYLS